VDIYLSETRDITAAQAFFKSCERITGVTVKCQLALLVATTNLAG